MLKLVERGFFKSPAIQLSDAGPGSVNPPVQVLRVGKFNHPKYGEFEISQKILAEMKSNFDNRVRGVDIAFDYFHDSDKEASGWPTELYLSEDGAELWAKVEWTPVAQKKLAEREIRYFSPDFAFQWKDPESGKVFKNVLFGGGLTNRPFVKDMAAIVASEKKGGIMNEEELKKLQETVMKLSEDNAKMKAEQEELKKKLAEQEGKKDDESESSDDSEESGDDSEPKDFEDAKKQLGEMKKKLAEMGEAHKKMLAEKAQAEEAKKMAERETEFNVLLSEGKACAAQKDSFMKGDMSNFIKLSQPVNVKGHGSSSTATEGAGDREDRVLKLAEEKCKADPKLGKIEAIRLANKEIQ